MDAWSAYCEPKTRKGSGLGRKITKWAMESMLRPLDRDNFVTIANKKHCSHVSTLGPHVLLR